MPTQTRTCNWNQLSTSLGQLTTSASERAQHSLGMLTALHGFTETDETWAEILAPLERPLRCPLLPGHGWSPCPAGTSLPSVAKDIARTLPAGDLLGYSLGGRLALQVALDYPAQVRRLVLISCTAGLPNAKERERRQSHDLHFAEVLEEDGIAPFVAWWERNPVLKATRPVSQAQADHLRYCRLNQDPHGLAGALRYLGTGAMANLWPRLGELRMPVLLIAGAADQRYASVMKEMAALIPGAKLQLIPSCGHAVHREAAEELLNHLRGFLS